MPLGSWTTVMTSHCLLTWNIASDCNSRVFRLAFGFAASCIEQSTYMLVDCIGLACHVDHHSQKVITINDWVGTFGAVTIMITDHDKHFAITSEQY